MPIYEYQCRKCRKEFECIVFGGDSTVTCPHCNAKKVERLLSACSFKSSGRYSSSAGASGCASCAGGTCSTCH